MAFSGLGSNGSGNVGRGRWRASVGTMSEMNVVPLVDVVLVLLIIFMITASTVEFGLEINVPVTKNTENTVQDRPVVGLGKSGEVYLNDEKMNLNLIGSEIKKRFPKADGVFVQADKAIQWEILAKVIDALNQAKVGKIMMVTTPESRK